MLSVDPGSYNKRLMEELNVNVNGDIIFGDVILEQLRTRSKTMKDVKTPDECRVIYDDSMQRTLILPRDLMISRKSPLSEFLRIK